MTLVINAQEESSSTWDIGFSYGLNIPAADMADRFGNNLRGEISFNYYLAPSQLQFGIKAGFLTGTSVNERVFESQLNSSGFLISDQGFPADVTTNMRGTIIGVLVNKNVVSINKKKDVFVFAGIGGGVIQHKIKFNPISGSVPQFEGDYAKGYDRNSIGPYLEQSLGIKFRKPRLKADIDFQLLEGFTKNVRPLNFDTRVKDDSNRLDLLIGMKVTYYIPVFYNLKKTKDIYY